jgi:hypothetical protein
MEVAVPPGRECTLAATASPKLNGSAATAHNCDRSAEML